MKSLILYLIFGVTISFAQSSWQSAIVYFDDNNELVYVSDEEGNRIPDFSYAGYRNSNVPLPDVDIVKTISPIEGDNTLHIQTAINEVGALPMNSSGFRGALMLTAGTYQVNGTLKINFSGVVLRGAGDGDNPDSNTIILGKGNTPSKRSIIIAGGGGTTKWSNQASGTKTNITTDTIFVGGREFEVENATPLSVGDNIIIFHPSTDSWLQAIDYGGTHSGETGSTPDDIPWQPGQENIVFNRYITAIEGNKITIDAPVFNHLIRSLSQSYVYRYTKFGIQTNIGIENLRIDIETLGGTDENHAWQAIDLYQIEDAWVKDCTMLHFGQSAVRTNTASRITVDNCRALDPVSLIEGEKRYNFNVYNASQLVLFKNCTATNGRHSYVSNGYSYTSGCVFLDCTSQGAYASSEGHRRWSTGLLWDNHKELDGPRPGLNERLIGLYNRGYYGTSHGWSAAHSVAWNCDVANGDIIVQKPPTAQNYAIGCSGARVTGVKPPASFDEPSGFIEGTDSLNLNPRSIFLAQLEERLNLVSINNESETGILPSEFLLYPNYPNPFNPSTTIKYYLPSESEISVKIFDSLGSEVTEVFKGFQNKGEYALQWNGIDNNGASVSSGIYIVTIKSATGYFSNKMLLLK
jgi:hypothetical protein